MAWPFGGRGKPKAEAPPEDPPAAVEFEADPEPPAEPAPGASEPPPNALRRLLARKPTGRRDAAARRRVVEKAEAVWRQRYVRPFVAWFDAQIPSTDYMGPGGVRYARDSVYTLAQVYIELHAQHDLGLGAPDVATLRDELALHRRDFEVLHRFLLERFPRVARPWVLQPFADEETFWQAFREAVRQFEEGPVDERLWVSGLIGMMSLAISWAGLHRAETV